MSFKYFNESSLQMALRISFEIIILLNVNIDFLYTKLSYKPKNSEIENNTHNFFMVNTHNFSIVSTNLAFSAYR